MLSSRLVPNVSKMVGARYTHCSRGSAICCPSLVKVSFKERLGWGLGSFVAVMLIPAYAFYNIGNWRDNR